MAHWGYTSENGPSTWVKDFPIADGPRQSPIDIVTSEAEYDASVEGSNKLTTNYVPETEIQLQNNGHSVQCSIKQTSVLTGGPLGDQKFRLEQFHLHWGSADDHGSEHTINDKAFASELHLVHWNSTKYKSFAEAVQNPDGLAVLGIMIKSGSTKDAFSPISDNVGKLKEPGQAPISVSATLDPTSLLPNNTSQYWTYEGSLTTPPLLECVQWIVFKEEIELSPQQLASLRSMTDSDHGSMQDNFRPPVPLKGRKVRASFQ